MPGNTKAADTADTQQQQDGQPQGADQRTSNNGSAADPGARNKDGKSGTTGAAGATGAGATSGTGTGTGTRKDTKTGTPPPGTFRAPPPPLQVLQLTPELFQQTVAAAVTAALTGSQQPAALQAESSGRQDRRTVS